MDLSEIEVTYDFWPNRPLVEGQAELTFQMRPGQTRPLFHFNPVRGAGETKLRRVVLDSETLSDADVRYLSPGRHAEPGYEISRDMSAGEHTLEVGWSVAKGAPPHDPRWFFPNFDDTEGPADETETLWPTVSSPDELATHVIHLRVHSGKRYLTVGSGEVTREPGSDRVQMWTVETPPTVSSSNVFFAAVPASQFRAEKLEVAGVEVHVLSNQNPDRTDQAIRRVRQYIPGFQQVLGPFPVPELSIFLTGWGSGMEYYGATRTALRALGHELGHMYFATTAVNRTWRDTWLDEAIVSWGDKFSGLDPIPREFVGHLADRPLLAPGFNEAAYGRGAQVMERIARALGGDEEMFAFLADLHARRIFEPFTTRDFIDDVVAAQDEVTREDLNRWFFGRT